MLRGPARSRATRSPVGTVISQDPPAGDEVEPGIDGHGRRVGAGPATVDGHRCHVPVASASAKSELAGAGLDRRRSAGPAPVEPAVPEPEQGRRAGPGGRARRSSAGTTVTLFTGRDHVADRHRPGPSETVAMTVWFARRGVHAPTSARILERHFTNLDGPGLRADEPARGREGRAVRALLADDEVAPPPVPRRVRRGRRGDRRADRARARRAAEQLYERVFVEYGDDSVAQLGGVHLACEQASQLLCKALEWGRLAAYLEQSTRYMRYDDRPGGRVARDGPARDRRARRSSRGSAAFLDAAFEAYGRMYEPLEPFYRERFPKDDADSDFVYRSDDHGEDVRHAADAAPGRDPLEPRDLRDRPVVRAAPDAAGAHPLAEMREYGELMLVELRKVIPAFLKRVDVDDRGVAWSALLARDARGRAGGHRQDAARRRPGTAAGGHAHRLRPRRRGEGRRGRAVRRRATSRTTSCSPSRARLTPTSSAPTSWRRRRRSRRTAGTSPAARGSAPATGSTCCCDYGAFRDLQRHRPLTIEWQRLTHRARLRHAGRDRRRRAARRLGRA